MCVAGVVFDDGVHRPSWIQIATSMDRESRNPHGARMRAAVVRKGCRGFNSSDSLAGLLVLFIIFG